MSQNLPNNNLNNSNSYLPNIVKKLNEIDKVLIKEYQLLISGKNNFIIERENLTNTINNYYNSLKNSFEEEHKIKLKFINEYFDYKMKEFNEIDNLLQNNKTIINNAIKNINIILNQNFITIRLIEQISLIDELKINTLNDDNINNKIKYFLFQLKNNLIVPKIIIDNKVYKLVQEVHSCFSIFHNSLKLSNDTINNININNLVKNINENINNNSINEVSKLYLNSNDIYIEDENNNLKKMIEEICLDLNKLKLFPNFLWVQPNSDNIYECIKDDNKLNFNKINYNYNNIFQINNSEKKFNNLFDEDFRVINSDYSIIYIIGGINNNTYEYSNINKTLTKKSSMNFIRKNHGIIHIKDFIYVCGGVDQNNNILNNCEKYDIKNNNWYNIKSMNEKLYKINLIKIDENAFACFGGLNSNNEFNHNIFYYRTDIDNWFILQNISLPYDIIYPGLCKVSKYIFILGGINQNGQETDNVLRMDINTGEIKNMDKVMNAKGYCLYRSFVNNNKIQILMNHIGKDEPELIEYLI